MKKVNFFAVAMVVMIATINLLNAQEKYAVIIGGNVNPNIQAIPLAEQWNGGFNPGPYGFDEIWNDAYLAWEMLISEEDFGKGYHLDNVHVLFGDSPVQDFTFPLQTTRYQAAHNGQYQVVDEDANKTTINNRFTALASTITADDFLFVWIMGHGGTDATGSYFYSYDNQKIHDTELAGWLNGISAHKKQVFLSFPKSGGFIPELEAGGNIVITACGATEGASRADDMAPNGGFIENEVINTIIYNHGEMNYHFLASLTGKTPLGSGIYAGVNLHLADQNNDNYVSVGEASDWLVSYETLNSQSPIISDIGNMKNQTGIKYPTLLFEHIVTGNVLTCRGLIGVTKTFNINSGATIRFFDNTYIHMLKPAVQIYGEIGSTTEIGDYVTFSSDQYFAQVLILSDNISIGSNLSLLGDSWADLYFICQNPLTILNLESITARNSLVNFLISGITIDNSSFANCTVQLASLRSVCLRSTFDNSLLTTNDEYQTDFISVSQCDFSNNSNNNLDYEYGGILIDDCDRFSIEHCNVSGYTVCGILVINSGNQSSLTSVIKNVTVTDITNSNNDGCGIQIYNSSVELSGLNNIYGNDFGIQSLNNSEVSLIGTGSANYVYETQQVHDNNVNQVYATSGAFPYKLRYNAIYDDDNDCLVKYIPDPTGITPNLNVRNNFWGTSFDPLTDLCPSSIYTWNPVWTLQIQNPPAGNDELLFTQAGTFVDSGQYVQANATYEQLINDYPTSDYAVAAIKEMFIIENISSENYNSLKTYFASIATQNPNTQICKTADFFSNLCDIQMENYSNAISWYEGVIQTPPSFEDSLFAIIDLGNLYIKMQNQGLKSAPIDKLTEYMANTKKQYNENRDYLISLLFKDDDKTMEQDFTLDNSGTASFLPNYPNPFAESTSFNYKLTEEASIEINVYDYTGKIVRILNEGSRGAGTHTTMFHAGDLIPGFYFCTIQCNGTTAGTQKITIIK